MCTRDFITLQDSLGTIGKSGINSDLMGKGSSFLLLSLCDQSRSLIASSSRWQGCTLTSHVLFAGKYCGGVTPRPLVSLTNRLTVYFNTNDMTSSKGFKAHYKAVAPELASGKSISAGK